MSAQTAKARLIWILAKDRTEAKTRHMTARDVAVMAMDRLRPVSLNCLTTGVDWVMLGQGAGKPLKIRTPR